MKIKCWIWIEGERANEKGKKQKDGYNWERRAISFDSVKVCYPFTIKGEWYSLLCCQPEAVPTSLTTFEDLITQISQCWPLIWMDKPKHSVFPGSLPISQPIHILNLQCDREHAPQGYQIYSQFIFKLYSHSLFNFYGLSHN